MKQPGSQRDPAAFLMRDSGAMWWYRACMGCVHPDMAWNLAQLHVGQGRFAVLCGRGCL